MAPHTIESVLVYGLVVVCAGYSLLRLLPRAVRQALRSAVAQGLRRLAGNGHWGWQIRLAGLATRWSAPVASTGCGGCDHCGPASAQEPAAAPTGDSRPIHWHPPRPR